MPPCNVCAHPDRGAIDAELAAGASGRALAKQYDLSRESVRNHRVSHLFRALAVAPRIKELAEAVAGGDLVGQVRHLQERVLSILRQAEQAADLRMALSAIKQARENLELLARLAGEIGRESPATTTVNVAVFESREWLDVQERLLRALAPFPDARAAAARALAGDSRRLLAAGDEIATIG